MINKRGINEFLKEELKMLQTENLPSEIGKIIGESPYDTKCRLLKYLIEKTEVRA